ncbi:hypothetical protein OROGR_024438 [Orobanche gracilis]
MEGNERKTFSPNFPSNSEENEEKMEICGRRKPKRQHHLCARQHNLCALTAPPLHNVRHSSKPSFLTDWRRLLWGDLPFIIAFAGVR